MKIRRKDGTEEEVAEGTKLEEGETEVKPEEGEKELEGLTKMIDEKVKEIIDAAKIGAKITKEVPTFEMSVMNPVPELRKKAPFVKLSKQMEDFVSDMKSIGKGGMPRSMIKALIEGDDPSGGFLVPEEFNAEVISHATELAIVRSRATVRPMGRDISSWPKLDQSTNQFGGIQFHWIGETVKKEESQPKFGKITLAVKKLIGLTAVGDELMEDAAVNLANYLVELFSRGLAYVEDQVFLTGNGMAKPLGIIPGTCNIVPRDEVGKIKYIDLKKMMTALPAWADAGAVWVTTKLGLENLLNIKSGVYDGTDVDETKGFPLLLPGFSLASGVPGTVLGYPIVLTDKLPTVGMKGDIILAQFREYWIGDRGPLAVMSSIHTRFEEDETVFRFVKRVDGQPAFCKAFVVLEGSGS